MRKKIHCLDRFRCAVATTCLLLVAVSRAGAASLPVVDLDFSDPAAIDQVEIHGVADLVDHNGELRLRLTEEFNQASSVWLRRPYQLPGYRVEFDFEVRRTAPGDQPADGFTFTAQQYGPVALGDGGGGLGYQHIPGYSYAVEFNTYSPQGLSDRPETVAVDIVGVRAKIGQVPFPHIDQGVFHADIEIRREAITVTLSGGSGNMPPTRVLTTPWWIQFVTDQPQWLGFTGATGGLRSIIEILNLKITPL